MKFHIATALKFAAVSGNRPMDWRRRRGAVAPVPDRFAASSLLRDQAPSESGLTGCRVICDARRSTHPTKQRPGASSSISRKPSSTTSWATAPRSVTASGSGREGFTWSGSQAVTRKAEWPDWTPPQEMIARQPYCPRWMAGGEGNPLGARAIYLGSTVYRIHGTNMPETIGQKVSSGCIRMLNADVIDLYSRVDVGTKIIVLPIYNNVAALAASPTPRL